jgi:outer membrane protein assembly factor BamD (BamD/ComL family)
MKTIKSLMPLVILCLVSCGPSKNKEISKIKSLEDRLYAPTVTTFNKPGADSLLQLYSAFIKKYPGDSLTRKYIFKAGNLYMTEGNGKNAIEMFDMYMTSYPVDPKTPICLFFKAFIYETIFNNLDKAQETYILFLEKYPRHEFANDAKASLSNLGKTPDQIVAQFEAKKKSDSARVADSLKKISRKKR